MSTIYKYNNYILKPLTILHLEVNTVRLVTMVLCEGNHCWKSLTFPADTSQVQILVCFHQTKIKTCFSYNSPPLYGSSKSLHTILLVICQVFSCKTKQHINRLPSIMWLLYGVNIFILPALLVEVNYCILRRALLVTNFLSFWFPRTASCLFTFPCMNPLQRLRF